MAETYDKLSKIFAEVAGSRKRHDEILRDCVREAKRVSPHDMLPEFAKYLARKLRKRESVIIGWPIMQAMNEPEITKPFERLQKMLFKTPGLNRLKSMPFFTNGKPMYLIVSRYSFRCAEIVRDIWLAATDSPTPEEITKNDYIVNCMRVADNLERMNLEYTRDDLVDCLNLIKDDGAFYLRGLFMLHVGIEPKPFIDHLEKLGFEINVILDEEESAQTDPEYAFLERLQGFIVAKNSSALSSGIEHMEFLIALCDSIPMPTGSLTSGRLMN